MADKVFFDSSNYFCLFDGYLAEMQARDLMDDTLGFCIRAKFCLEEQYKTCLSSGHNQLVVAAGTIWNLTKGTRTASQRQIAIYFGVTEVSIRNYSKKIDEMNKKL